MQTNILPKFSLGPEQLENIPSEEVNSAKNLQTKSSVGEIALANIQAVEVSKSKKTGPKQYKKNTTQLPDQKNISRNISQPSSSKASIVTTTSRNNSLTLENILENFYNKTQNTDQKRACLHYLLHYQHYNAEFTSDDRKLLNYSEPLCASENNPIYVRLQYPLLMVMERWLKTNLFPRLKGNNKKDVSFIRLGNPLIGPSAIELIVPNRIFRLGNEKLEKMGADFIPILLFPLTLSDLTKKVDSMVIEDHPQLKQLKEKWTELHFIFLMKEPGIECQIMWAAKWLRNGSLMYVTLNTLFDDKDISSFLNQIGDIPDRLEVNKFISRGLENEKFYNIPSKAGISISPLKLKIQLKESWDIHLKKIRNYNLKNHPGAALFRDAILRWNTCLFEYYQMTEFTSPLLISQVAPWTAQNGDIIQWSKAYQNICEIVMLTLQYNPSNNLPTTHLSLLLVEKFKSQDIKICIKVGLFPYGMTAFYYIFDQLLKRSASAPQVICLSQSYFEIIKILQKVVKNHSNDFPNSFCNSLNELNEIPDILIADLHANNAANDRIVPNDVAKWIKDRLEKDHSKKLILILDLTLNHLSDESLNNALQILYPLIEQKRLEIFGIQSLAKLVQLGSDNFSGGICIYWGSSSLEEKLVPQFPSVNKEKSIFFALLYEKFDDLTREYFKLVRKNTENMYLSLRESFLKIEESVQIKRKAFDDSSNGRTGFCAAEIKFNGDDNTVYIAIGFKPLFKLFGIEKIAAIKTKQKRKEQIAQHLQKIILKFSHKFKLSITNRQSFGFSISNMNVAADTIRFTLGLETLSQRESYAQLITEFVFLLSSYSASLAEYKETPQFEAETFSHLFDQASTLLKEPKSSSSLYGLSSKNIPLVETDNDEETEQRKIGDARIIIHEEQFVLKMVQNGIPVFKLLKDIPIGPQHSTFNNPEFSLLRLFFDMLHLIKLDAELSYQVKRHSIAFPISTISYTLENKKCKLQYCFNKSPHKLKGSSSGVQILFEPRFCLKIPSKNGLLEKKSCHVYTMLLDHVKKIRLDKMDLSDQHAFFTKCARYNFETTSSENVEDECITVNFTTRKPYLNYYNEVRKPFIYNGFDAIKNSLSDLELDDLEIKSYNDDINGLKSYCLNIVLNSHPFYPALNNKAKTIQRFYVEGLKGVVHFLGTLKLDDLPLPHDFDWYKTWTGSAFDQLCDSLETIGSQVVYHPFDELMEIIDLIKDEKCKKGLLHGMLNGLMEDNFKNPTLNQETAQEIAKLLSHPAFLSLDYCSFIDQWIENLNRHLEAPMMLEKVNPYLTAFFPLIKHVYGSPKTLCDTEHTIPLRLLANKLEHKDLQTHIDCLENELVENASEGRPTKTSIRNYLRLYSRYPLSDIIKNHLLLTLKNKVEKAILLSWLIETNFYFSPINDLEIENIMPENHEIFYEKDRQAIKTFFLEMGCKDILFELLKTDESKLQLVKNKIPLDIYKKWLLFPDFFYSLAEEKASYYNIWDNEENLTKKDQQSIQAAFKNKELLSELLDAAFDLRKSYSTAGFWAAIFQDQYFTSEVLMIRQNENFLDKDTLENIGRYDSYFQLTTTPICLTEQSNSKSDSEEDWEKTFNF
ncbi:MAG: hypothetical protein H0V82_00180 [Candidatus Protochlamydia sp.]|nr:hypothetical protein [Candidatus Protochlamydia sp.]